MDAPCKIQGSIHVFRLVNNMCPGKWVHITRTAVLVCLFSDFFVKNGENEKGCRHECGDTAGSGTDFIREKESA